MKVYEIKSGNTNCYLIQMFRSGKWVLIDAGTADDKKFLEKIQQVTPLEQISLLVLTHGHYDHVGYAAELQQNYGVKILMHADDQELVENGKMDFPPANNKIGKLIRWYHLRKRSKKIYPPFHPDIVINQQTKLEEFPELEFLPLPGHTMGSIGVVYGEILFAGDLMMNLFSPSPSWFAEDFKLLAQSMDTVKNRKLSMIYPGHGKRFPLRALL